jgi:hypothetical protein
MTRPATARGPAGQLMTLVADHLRHRGIIGVGRPADALPPADRTAALGVPGIAVDDAGGVTAFGHRCCPQERTVADLLDAGTGAGPYVVDRAALDAARAAGENPVLYHAYRDFLPPRDLSTGQCLPAGTPGYDGACGTGYLFADLVVYQRGTLAGGEPFRSTGHWNLPWQLEIFQTLTGRVLMLVAGHDGDGRPFRYERVCGPGETMAVPFGIWHVSYGLDGPAAVFNVAADLSALAGQGTSATARQDPAKYRRAEPVAATARRRGSGYEITGSPDACAWPEGPGSRGDDWLDPFLAQAGSLAALHLCAPRPVLADLQRAAIRACGPGPDALAEPRRPAVSRPA